MNPRVPWHTHLYRAGRSIFTSGEAPCRVHLMRALRATMGDRRYAPTDACELLSEIRSEQIQIRTFLETAHQNTLHEMDAAGRRIATEFSQISRHLDRSQPAVMQTIEALGRSDKPPVVGMELDFIARSLTPLIETRQSRSAMFSVALGADYRDAVRGCLQSHADYCSRHNLTRALLQTAPNRQTRPTPWYKIPLALQLLREGHDYILHLDADCLITNPHIEPNALIDRLRTQPTRCLLLAEDEEGINCGVFLLKNTPDAVRLLNLVWSYRHAIDHVNWEQEALKRVVEDYPRVGELLLIEPNGGQFNKFPAERREFHPSVANPPNVWAAGDFICHFSGIREPHLAKLIERYVRICGQ